MKTLTSIALALAMGLTMFAQTPTPAKSAKTAPKTAVVAKKSTAKKSIQLPRLVVTVWQDPD